MLIRTVNSNSGSMNRGPFLCFHSQFSRLASLLEEIFSELFMFPPEIPQKPSKVQIAIRLYSRISFFSAWPQRDLDCGYLIINEVSLSLMTIIYLNRIEGLEAETFLVFRMNVRRPR